VLAADPGTGGNSLLTFLPIILLFVAAYFILIRPQSKRRREAQQMQSHVSPGDEIQTVGGMFATVVSVADDIVTVEPSPGVQMRYVRGAIARVVTAKATEEETAGDDAIDDDANDDAKKAIEQG
jgi:preprotein translocase subunit YajC